MTKQSKLTLGLDIKPFRREVKAAKQAVEELTKLPIDRQISRAFRTEIVRDFKLQTKEIKDNIKLINDEMKNLIRSGDASSDKFRALGKQLRDNYKILQDTRGVMRSAQFGGGFRGGGGFGGGGGAAGGGDLAGAVKGAMGGVTSALRKIGIGVGISAAIQRQITQASEGMQIRELTGGGIVNDESQFGFTRSERRARAVDIARGAGRNLSNRELEDATRRSEVAQRAFGISGDQFGAATGAARRAGGGDDAIKFASDAIGDAVAIKLEGSKVGEYLSGMTSYMESISRGVDIDTKSLRGFAQALGELDFFKQDPGRIFDTIRGLDQAMQRQDPYGSYLSYRSIQEAAGAGGGGPLSPSGVEIRKQMGLFGKVNERDLAEAPAELRRSLSINSGEMINAFLKTAYKDVEKLAPDDQFLAFQSATNLQAGQALPIYNRMRRGGELSPEMIKSIEESLKSPEELAQENMKTFEGSVLKFSTEIDTLFNALTQFTTEGVLKFVDAVGGFDNAVGLLVGALVGKGALGLGGMTGGLPIPGGGAGSKALGFIGKGGAVVGAAAAGYLIGEAMRDKMNEWTEGGWDKGVQKFWTTGLEYMGFDFGGDVAEERRKKKDEEREKYGAAEMVSAYRKRNPDADITPELIDRMVRTRRRGSEGDELMPLDDTFFDQLSKPEYGGGDMSYYGTGIKYQFGGPVYMADGGTAYDKRAKAIGKAFGKGGKKIDLLEKLADVFSGDTASETFTKSIKKATKRQFGGPIYMADGGPIGTDTIPAWLTHGEFVVNARSTAMNRSALEHANNGGLIKPAEGDSSFLMNNMAALGSNTGALQNLTLALLKMANKPSALREIPRGPSVSRYG